MACISLAYFLVSERRIREYGSRAPTMRQVQRHSSTGSVIAGTAQGTTNASPAIASGVVRTRYVWFTSVWNRLTIS